MTNPSDSSGSGPGISELAAQRGHQRGKHLIFRTSMITGHTRTLQRKITRCAHHGITGVPARDLTDANPPLPGGGYWHGLPARTPRRGPSARPRCCG